MSADRGVVIYIDNLPASDREKCLACSAQGTDYRGQIPFPTCKIAKIEKRLLEKPKLGQIRKSDIDITNVPGNCPNGY